MGLRARQGGDEEHAQYCARASKRIFLAACLHGEKLLVTPAQAIGNVAVMEAFVESASHDGRWTAVRN